MITYSQLGKNGRLGNQMFQIAATIGIAKWLDVHFAFQTWEHQDFFETPLPALNEFEKAYKLIPIAEKNFRAAEWSEFCGVNFTDADVQGYRQSPKYWEPHAKELIDKYFEPKWENEEWASWRYLKLIEKRFYPSLGKIIALHVRRGDYVGLSQYHTDLAASNYYERAIELIKPKHDYADVYVFSDDLAFCKEKFRNYVYGDPELHYHFVEPKSDVEDLFVMSMFRNIVIANSSFSWWAAYLTNKINNKLVVAPGHDRWFGPAYKGTHNTIDLFPKEWVLV